MIQLIILIYIILVVLAAFKMAQDIFIEADQMIPFEDCLTKVLFDSRSYKYILMPWKVL